MIPFFAKMQRKGYLHRDIKPDNILLVKNVFNKTEYKVGDFGFSIKLNAYSTQNIAGTMEYVSPKLLVKFKDNKVIVPGHNFKDDVYSFGKTLYELMALEVNTIVDSKKLVQCSNRYGAEYCGLVMLMLK
jgi:serine/threonine protein kinase